MFGVEFRAQMKHAKTRVWPCVWNLLNLHLESTWVMREADRKMNLRSTVSCPTTGDQDFALIKGQHFTTGKHVFGFLTHPWWVTCWSSPGVCPQRRAERRWRRATPRHPERSSPQMQLQIKTGSAWGNSQGWKNRQKSMTEYNASWVCRHLLQQKGWPLANGIWLWPKRNKVAICCHMAGGTTSWVCIDEFAKGTQGLHVLFWRSLT